MLELRPSARPEKKRAALVRSSGPLAGLRYFLDTRPVTRLGRNPDNDIVIRGPDSVVVSGCHAEIRGDGDNFHLKDLDSTNGTFVNGQRVTQATVRPPATIQLGAGGPEMLLTLDDTPAEDLNKTVALNQTVVVQAADVATPDVAGGCEEDLLREAVARARIARARGVTGQTTALMRDVIQAALGKTRRKFRWIILALVLLLAAVSGYSWWQIHTLKATKAAIDAQIRSLEAQLEHAQAGSAEADVLITTLQQYQTRAQALEQSVFYRLGVRQREEFIEREVRLLLAEFGAETYSVPPEFIQEVHQYIEQYRGPDRPNMEKALGEARPVMERMRGIFERESLPPDLTYMVLVESGLSNSGRSTAGSTGFWQFTAPTARALGMRVGDGVDERLSLVKSTNAAAKYIRNLILDFGAGTSVMLAIAAYNVGPSRVTGAIRRLARDPIKQRSFWYLYRMRALPEETRAYVPKVIAAMIIGRNPGRFGF